MLYITANNHTWIFPYGSPQGYEFNQLGGCESVESHTKSFSIGQSSQCFSITGRIPVSQQVNHGTSSLSKAVWGKLQRREKCIKEGRQESTRWGETTGRTFPLNSQTALHLLTSRSTNRAYQQGRSRVSSVHCTFQSSARNSSVT